MGLPGGAEWMIIFVVALLLFGAKKLPELARGMGRAMGEFKSARREFEDELRRAEYDVREEPKKLPQTSTVATTPSSSPDPPVHGSEEEPKS